MHELTAFAAQPWDTEAGTNNDLADTATAELVLRKPHTAAAFCLEPFDLLRPERCALPLLGRAGELAALVSWLGCAPPLSIRRLVGPAGTGKTRLAMELCRRAEAQGWSAGFATVQAVTQVATETSRRWSREALLVVVDGTGMRDEPLVECCARLARSGQHSKPLRLLLLDRTPPEPAGSRTAPTSAGALPELAEPVHLGGLRSAADRRTLLGRAMAQAARFADLPACPPPAAAALDAGEPLHLLMAALVAPHQGVVAALARSPAVLADELAASERTRLERLAWQQRLDPNLVWHLIACVTLQDGCSLDAAPELVRQEAEGMGMHLPEPTEHVADCLADRLLAADDQTLEPLGPAPIGEAFLVRELARHAPERQAAIIERALHRARAATADTLRRAAEFRGGADPSHPTLAWSRQAGA